MKNPDVLLSLGMKTPRRVYASLILGDPPVPVVQPNLVTLPNVELLEVGEDWVTSTGTFTFSLEHLQSAIASQDDPFVRTPIIKLGHTDPRFDGQPSIGRVENLHLSDNGQTLMGDLTGMPLWIAECAGTAYPRRSIEGWFDYTTRTDNEWPFVLTGLALLGTAYPAIDSLEDIKALFGGTPPVLLPVEENESILAANGVGPLVMFPANDRVFIAATAPTSIMADASVDDVRNAYYDGPASGPDMYWWWIREIRVDPAELIVDDDAGNLYRVPYTVASNANGKDAVTFGDAQMVRIQYVNVVQAGQSVHSKFGNPVAAGRPRARVIVSSSSKEGTDMQLSAEVLSGLGLTAEATEEEVNAALIARLTSPVPADPPAPESEITVITPPVSELPAVEPLAATTPEIPEGMQLIDQATLELLRNGATIAASLQTERDDRIRGQVLDTAIRAGKFPPARRDHYELLLKADPEGTTTLIDSLADGLIPVTEVGTEGGTEVSATADKQYPDSWKPLVAAATRPNSSSRVKVGAD
jgi:hypothetical protein